ncbi:hypothetical protein [Archangium lansingense]|uniref:DUF1634 domain-containing protein n=1 Tax=Archangium lansingense TaxID=2995310 RepID=A0ABT4AE78_9BACT|nr:hypothetical protein [Archangium lansinium]MCY1079978.1 hypothetical protein [Archangium lansinium]
MTSAPPVVTGAIPVKVQNTVQVELPRVAHSGQRETAPPQPQSASAAPVIPGRASTSAQVARAEAGEQWISRLLRGGAMCSGGLFLASLALESLPQSETVHVAIDVLRKGAASALLVTPVVRLVVAGTTLGIRGEWKYALYAAGVLGLLALAVGAGLHA